MNFKEWSLWGLAILAVLAAFVFLFGGMYYTGHQNMLKQIKMTQYCIQHGFHGWTDDTGRYGNGNSTCI